MPSCRPTLPVLLLGLFLASPAFASASLLVPFGNLSAVGRIPAGEPLEVRVVMDGQGRFLVAWPRDGQLVARRFAVDGTPVGGELVVFDRRGFGGVGNRLGDLAMNDAGEWAAAWIGSGPVDQPVVMLRRFAADGAVLETQRVDVDPEPGELEERSVVCPPAVAVGEDGVAVAWVESVSEPGSSLFRRLLVRTYDASGTPGGEPQIVDGAVFFERPDVALLPGGVVAVTAVTFGGDPLATSAPLYLVAADGTPLPVEQPAGAAHPAQVQPRLAATGQVVLHTYGDEGGQGPDGADGSCGGVFATMHRADGSVLVDEVRLNPFTVGCQFGPRAAAVDPLPGWAVMSWADAGADLFFGSDDRNYGVFVSAIRPEGEVLGPLRALPGWVVHHELAAGGGLAVVAAVLSPRPGAPARVVARRLSFPISRCEAAPGDDHLCLLDGRFRVGVSFRDPYAAGGRTGFGTARPVSADSGALWFFSADNLELLVKVLDGVSVNDHRWVFYGALSTVEYWLDVVDLYLGDQRVYYNPPFSQASRGDATAFPDLDPDLPTGALPAPVVGAASPWPELAPAPMGIDLPSQDCGLDPTLLCLGQFGVRVSWHDPRSGARGEGRRVLLTNDTGAFWFFREDNLELMIKILDGGPVNGHHWVFYGSLTDVELTVEIVDFLHDRSVTYHNAPFELRSRADTTAFPSLPLQ